LTIDHDTAGETSAAATLSPVDADGLAEIVTFVWEVFVGGDIAEATADGGYRFAGRATDAFKLSNGRMVPAPYLEAAIRRDVPQVTDVVLAPQAGALLDVLYSTADARPVPDTRFRAVLGGLAEYLGRSIRVDCEQWVRTPKGDIDRRRLPLTD
jgi:hypothetical protein